MGFLLSRNVKKKKKRSKRQDKKKRLTKQHRGKKEQYAGMNYYGSFRAANLSETAVATKATRVCKAQSKRGSGVTRLSNKQTTTVKRKKKNGGHNVGRLILELA